MSSGFRFVSLVRVASASAANRRAVVEKALRAIMEAMTVDCVVEGSVWVLVFKCCPDVQAVGGMEISFDRAVTIDQ
jgi:hypothetical protein